MLIGECVKRFEELSNLSDSARLDVEILLAHVIGKDRTYLYTWPEKSITEHEYADFEVLLARRKKGEPIAHIIGEREFWSLPLYTNASTLIPRPDTEILVEWLVDNIDIQAPLKILDLGTGTGAIAIALASEFKNAEVTGVDFLTDSVTLAKKNVARHHLSNIRIFQSDWFSNVEGQFDFIVSNPPYIDESDPHLSEGDVRFEPMSALTAKQEGLADISYILSASESYLAPNGGVLLEHGWRQAEAVQGIFASEGFHDVETLQDYSGNDRITLGWRKA